MPYFLRLAPAAALLALCWAACNSTSVGSDNPLYCGCSGPCPCQVDIDCLPYGSCFSGNCLQPYSGYGTIACLRDADCSVSGTTCDMQHGLCVGQGVCGSDAQCDGGICCNNFCL